MSKQGMSHRRMERPVGPAWEAQAAETFVDLRGWRTAQPRATLKEIEEELDRRWEPLRARLLADLALASAAADLQAAEEGARPRCATCGAVLHDAGTHERTLVTLGNQPVALRRDYGTCPRCGSGLFPPGR